MCSQKNKEKSQPILTSIYFLLLNPISTGSLTVLLFLSIGCSAKTPVSCDLRKDLQTSSQSKTAISWQQIYQACQTEIESYQDSDKVGFTWFANAANGFAGTPLVILKSLPALAPEIWGPANENFSKFGLFSDPHNPDRVLPRGLGVASPNGRPLDENGNMNGEIDYSKPAMFITTFSCGACHSGRVKTDQGYKVLEGAPNTQFDVRAWRQAFIDTRAKYFNPQQIGTVEAPGETSKKLIAYIDAQEPGFFARGLPLLANADQVAIDAQQRAIVKANMVTILTGVAQAVRASDWMIKLQTSYGRNYGYPNHSPGLAGNSAGQSDGSGDLLVQLIAMTANLEPGLTEEAFLARPHKAIPPFATVTDIPSVWNQKERSAAQWDGSVGMGFWRNIAAQLPIVGDPSKIDLDNTHIVDKFLTNLPPAPYPFAVDLVMAAKGQKLYGEHCADCHSANSTQSYWQMMTDFNRARVLNEEARNLFLTSFTAGCHDKEYSFKDSNGNTIKPCQMDGAEIIRDTTKIEEQGYMASVLDGIWARAPYLHNGSVPTMRHLLVPYERPKQFLRGIQEYDQKDLGWVWQVAKKPTYQNSENPTLMVFDSSSDGLSNLGHDQDININGKLYRLNWSGDEVANDLENLLEYLKTL
jgi:cytochrome c peroxidase